MYHSALCSIKQYTNPHRTPQRAIADPGNILPRTTTDPARENPETFLPPTAEFLVGEGEVLDVALRLAEMVEVVDVEDDELLAMNSSSRLH